MLTVENRIHELVRATVPAAQPPRLHVEPLGTQGVRIRYDSERRLCVLLEGLIRGTAAHYEEDVDVREPECMLRGDPACVFDVRLSPRATAAAWEDASLRDPSGV